MRCFFANEGSGLAIFSTELDHIIENNVGNDFRETLRGKGLHKPEYAYDIVRILSLKMYTDLIEYIIVGDTTAPLLRYFPSISKLKSGDIIATGQYVNYQTFGKLQFRPLLKIVFHNIHIHLCDTRGLKKFFVSVGFIHLDLMLRKTTSTHF